jgi:hypothetical protein
MSISDNSMAIVLNTVNRFAAGDVFLFESLSYITEQKGVLHRVVSTKEEAPRSCLTGAMM